MLGNSIGDLIVEPDRLGISVKISFLIVSLTY